MGKEISQSNRQNISRRVLSDVVVPKRTVADQMFHNPPPRLRHSSGGGWRRWRVPIVLLAILGLAILASFWWARMEVRVTTRVATTTLDASSLLTKDPQEENKLFARTISVSDVREGVFSGSFTTAPVERRARGRVVVFNKSSQAPQVLIATTRLETPDGKIYRVPQAVTIPGYTRENGEIVPGSREVEVIADKPGEEYNIGLTDFTIPGFRGSSKFQTVFARSKTEMEGGFRGTQETVRAEDLERAVISLRAEGEANKEGLLRAKISQEAFLLKDSVEYVILNQEALPIDGKNDSFRLVLRAEARGIMVGRDEFAKLVSNPPLPPPFRIANLDKLNYKLERYSYEDDPGLVRVSGDAVLESLIDVERIRAFIAERRVAASRGVLEAFGELESVVIRFRPFWFKRTPSDPARIDIFTVSR